jgi:hypothetical protein
MNAIHTEIELNAPTDLDHAHWRIPILLVEENREAQSLAVSGLISPIEPAVPRWDGISPGGPTGDSSNAVIIVGPRFEQPSIKFESDS